MGNDIRKLIKAVEAQGFSVKRTAKVTGWFATLMARRSRRSAGRRPITGRGSTVWRSCAALD